MHMIPQSFPDDGLVPHFWRGCQCLLDINIAILGSVRCRVWLYSGVDEQSQGFSGEIVHMRSSTYFIHVQSSSNID